MKTTIIEHGHKFIKNGAARLVGTLMYEVDIDDETGNEVSCSVLVDWRKEFPCEIGSSLYILSDDRTKNETPISFWTRFRNLFGRFHSKNNI